MADAGPCLTDPDPEKAPFFDTPPDDTGDALTGEPAADSVAPASRTVTGKFTLGNGQPTPGLVVRLLASDVDIDATDPTKETVVGDATTQAPHGDQEVGQLDQAPGREGQAVQAEAERRRAQAERAEADRLAADAEAERLRAAEARRQIAVMGAEEATAAAVGTGFSLSRPGRCPSLDEAAGHWVAISMGARPRGVR
ncbi:hypothetical protein [Streptomyces griseoluteus]|uniref:hypothetical protein n=1 Tax=Streptomyces griseoluteus TaxID=29306 RepID=UPI00368CBB97